VNFNQATNLFVALTDHTMTGLVNNKWYVCFMFKNNFNSRPAIVDFNLNDFIESLESVTLK
jgi:hypothetical protein